MLYRGLQREGRARDAYLIAPRIFKGVMLNEIERLAKAHCETTLKDYYFRDSVEILEALSAAGIAPVIISASAEFFVTGSLGTLPLLREHLVGIRTHIDEAGKITDTIIDPITFAAGKVDNLVARLERIQEKWGHPCYGRGVYPFFRIFVLAGFGNSYRTDGPFLEYIATRKLPAGAPVSVMINGGEPPSSDKGLFVRNEFDVTISGK